MRAYTPPTAAAEASCLTIVRTCEAWDGRQAGNMARELRRGWEWCPAVPQHSSSSLWLCPHPTQRTEVSQGTATGCLWVTGSVP